MKDEVVFADDDELDLTPKLIHNRYKIIKQVGQGSFGVVWYETIIFIIYLIGWYTTLEEEKSNSR
jgi:hypothetical protein